MSRHQHIPQRYDTELGTIYKCLSCGQDITRWTRKLQNLYIKQRYYQAQGQSYTSWFMGMCQTIQTGGILALIFGGDNARTVAPWIFFFGWLAQTIFETWMGRMDFKKWKMAQRQTTLGASFTPTTVETLRILNELRDKIAPELKKPSILDNQLK